MTTISSTDLTAIASKARTAARLDREWAETKIAALRKEIASAEKQIASAEKKIKRLELDYLCDDESDDAPR